METSVEGLVIITGSSSGIGAACAERFASAGWNLVLTARRMERLEKISRELSEKHKIKVYALESDVRETTSGEKLADFLQKNKLIPDTLINNAGLAVGLSSVHEGVADDWERMIDTNIKGLLYISRAIAPLMVRQKRGHIINIGSIAGKEAYSNGNVYVATKFAVDGLTKSMRIDLLPHNIKVTQISPGAVETEFSNVRFKGDDERAAKVYQGFQPLSANDVADVVLYAASLPPHVNINDLVLMPTAQAGSSIFHKVFE